MTDSQGITFDSATECWIAVYEESGAPILSTSGLGSYIPVYTNPISALEWLDKQPSIKGYVREISILFLPSVAYPPGPKA